jgi:rod shape-determining protein MreB
MVVDIGGGTTDVAVISLSGIVTSSSIRCGGDKMDEAIINYVKRKYNMLIGERTAEHVKMTVATAAPQSGSMETMEIKGRDLVAGIPKVVVATSEEIAEALVEPIHSIVETVHLTLEKTPPELAADIVDRGIMLVGGGSLLRDFDHVLREETKLPILRSDDPFSAVVHGAGKALDNLPLLKDVALS